MIVQHYFIQCLHVYLNFIYEKNCEVAHFCTLQLAYLSNVI
jgi:hypothetical protein